MIKTVLVINDNEELKEALELYNLPYRSYWNNYIWLDKTNYYRLVLFTNGNYGLFTQSQLPIVQAHQELNSSDWRDYKMYADAGYKVMRDNGVVAGSAVGSAIDDNNKIWTPIKKAEFRKTDEWKTFRRKCLDGNMVHLYMCDDCRKFFQESEVQVHHLKPEYYDYLDRSLFKVLCKECHDKYTHDGL